MTDKPQKTKCVCGCCFPSPPGSLCGGQEVVKSESEADTFEIKFTEKEKVALKELSKKKDLSPEAVIRQALRFYQLMHAYMSDGYSIRWVDKEGNENPALAPKGCGWPGMD